MKYELVIDPDSLPEVKLPFKADIWKEDLPIGGLSEIVTALVGLCGDEYAVPLAKAIQGGIQLREKFNLVSVDVSVVKRAL